MNQTQPAAAVYEVSYYDDFGRQIYLPATADLASAEAAWKQAKTQGIETARVSQVSVPHFLPKAA